MSSLRKIAVVVHGTAPSGCEHPRAKHDLTQRRSPRGPQHRARRPSYCGVASRGCLVGLLLARTRLLQGSLTELRHSLAQQPGTWPSMRENVRPRYRVPGWESTDPSLPIWPVERRAKFGSPTARSNRYLARNCPFQHTNTRAGGKASRRRQPRGFRGSLKAGPRGVYLIGGTPASAELALRIPRISAS